MAEAPKSLEYLLSCPVCFEDFEDNGEHVPKLLPCTHTLCEQCIQTIVKANKLECPQCKKKHDTQTKEKNFPQNQYILMMIKMKDTKL